MDYSAVKSMVVDILKTEDGQKAIGEATLRSSSVDSTQLRILQTGEGQKLQMAVKEILSDPAYALPLKEMMVDPKFAGDFAKALRTEMKDINKALIKDPEYQQALIDVMKDPQIKQMILETMKGSEYRKQMMTVMKESFDNPLFKADILKLMEKALEEQSKPKKDKEKATGTETETE